MGDEAVDVVDEVVVEAEDAQLGEAGEGTDLGVGNLRVGMRLFSHLRFVIKHAYCCYRVTMVVNDYRVTHQVVP